jgi:hypothetical protein
MTHSQARLEAANSLRGIERAPGAPYMTSDTMSGLTGTSMEPPQVLKGQIQRSS